MKSIIDKIIDQIEEYKVDIMDLAIKEKLPIILDEAFAFYDDERLANIMKFLNKEYEDRQVIIFTCSNREKKIIDEEKIPVNIVLI